MSLAASNWAWQQTCVAARAIDHTDEKDRAISASPVAQKLVLLFLADAANANGECYPGLHTICSRTGMEIKTARKAIQRLVEQGLLTRERRDESYKNKIQTSIYRLPVVAPPAPTTLPSRDIVVDFLPKEATGGYQVRQGGDAKFGIPPPSQVWDPPHTNFDPDLGDYAGQASKHGQDPLPNLAPEPSKTPLSTKESPCTKQTTRETPRARKRAQPPSSGKPSAKVSDAVAIWNELVGSKLHLVLASRLSDKRVRRLDDILSSPDFANPDAWRRFCADIARSGFLCGENERGWHANFDWVLKQDNLIKILEGGYRPIAKPPPVVAKQNGWNPSGMTGYI